MLFRSSLLFPEEEADEEAFDMLLSGGRAAKTRNRRVTAFVTAVKLLAIAGFDPAQDEPAGEHHLSSGALSLLSAFRDYRWEKPFEGTIPASLFNEAAEYLDRFITEYCGMTLHTAGAFTDKNTKF